MFERFSKLTLDESVALYKEQYNKAGSPISENYRLYAEEIYDKFFSALNEMVYEKYRHIFLRMGFDTDWHFDEYDQALTIRRTSFSIIYDMDESGMSDYEPLIRFVINLNQDKLNSEYVATIFDAMSEKLAELFEKTFAKWSTAMVEYYSQVRDQYPECAKGEYYDTPMDDPESYFLTHKIVMLR